MYLKDREKEKERERKLKGAIRDIHIMGEELLEYFRL
jgi:hypothetical protein